MFNMDGKQNNVKINRVLHDHFVPADEWAQQEIMLFKLI